jgi:monoamine oxidase
MGEEIPADAPWDAPHAQEWDTMTFKEFLDRNTWTEAARDFATVFITMCVTSEPYESSLLWFLWYVKQCGGTRPIFSTTNGGQERKIIGGSMQISERMAEKVGKDRVLLNKPVVGITQTNNEVIVRALDGTEYKGKYLIMALAPPMQHKIHFSPPLPPLRNQLNQRCPMGSVMKAIVYYETPFWRAKGFCGSMMIEGLDDCPVPFTLDDTKPDGSVPAIIGYSLSHYFYKKI